MNLDELSKKWFERVLHVSKATTTDEKVRYFDLERASCQSSVVWFCFFALKWVGQLWKKHAQKVLMSQVYRDISLLTSGGLEIEMSFVATILEDSFSCQYCPHQVLSYLNYRIRHCASSRIIISHFLIKWCPELICFWYTGSDSVAGRLSLSDWLPSDVLRLANSCVMRLVTCISFCWGSESWLWISLTYHWTWHFCESVKHLYTGVEFVVR